jgi:hypothetical protein
MEPTVLLFLRAKHVVSASAGEESLVFILDGPRILSPRRRPVW